MVRVRKEKKRDFSHHERYADTTPENVPPPASADISREAAQPPVRESQTVLGESAYLKRELSKVLMIAAFIAALLTALNLFLVKNGALDSFIAGLKIN